jgi:hypothetical protein
MIAAAGARGRVQREAGGAAAADTSVNVPRLDAILFLLGIPADEIVLDPDDDEPPPTGPGCVEVRPHDAHHRASTGRPPRTCRSSRSTGCAPAST